MPGGSGVWSWGGVWSRGVLHAGGVSGPGGSPCQGGCLVPGGFSLPDPPPVNRMTDRCKNITLAKTSFRPVIMFLYICKD